MSYKSLEVSGLYKNINNKKILYNINLNLNEGDICALVGLNGTGKTILLSTIAKLIYPNKGLIDIKNNYIPSILHQTPSFYPYLTGKDNLKILAYSSEQAMININIFSDSNHILTKKVSDLSYGQKKKLAISIALSKDSNIFLLDEPTNGLDLHSCKAIVKIIKSMSLQKKTFLISCHDWSFIEHCCNKLMIMHKGTIKKTLIKDSFDQKQFIIKTNVEIDLNDLKKIETIQSCEYIKPDKIKVTTSSSVVLHKILSDNNIYVDELIPINKTYEWKKIYEKQVNLDGDT